MIDRAYELEVAASTITPETLQAAKSAIAEVCKDYIRWAVIFSERLESIQPADLHKFTRAMALTMLGHLPTRPTTCPFCIQYGRDRSCEGCEYARTHGRCDSVTSAFSQFIEAFQELGKAIYQDTSPNIGSSIDPAETKNLLRRSIDDSAKAARQMLSDLSEASAFRLMELKAQYLSKVVCLIPVSLLSDEISKKCNEVIERLKNYW